VDGELISEPRPVLYGREAVVADIARSRAPVLLLTGDSGVGKSSVLRTASDAVEGSLVCGPVSLASGQDLQAAVLTALAAGTRRLMEEGVAQAEVEGVLGAAAARLTREYAYEFAAAVAHDLLRRVLGDHATDVLTRYIETAQEMSPERLEPRLDALAAVPASQVVAELTAEVQRLAGMPIVVVIDEAEQMPADDDRLLVGLSRRLSDTCTVWLAFSTPGRAEQKRVDELIAMSAARIDQVDLAPLGADDVAAWLAAEGAHGLSTADVMAATSGYPLDIGDTIEAAQRGQPLDEVALRDRHTRFHFYTKRNWDELEPADRVVVNRLAVLPAPLGADALGVFLGYDAAECHDLIRVLLANRLFTYQPDGSWFHDKRRRLIAEVFLEPAERDDLIVAAADGLWRAIVAHSLGTLFPTFAAVASPAKAAACLRGAIDAGDVRAFRWAFDRQLALSAAIVQSFALAFAPISPRDELLWGEYWSWVRRTHADDADRLAALHAAYEAGARGSSVLIALLRLRADRRELAAAWLEDDGLHPHVQRAGSPAGSSKRTFKRTQPSPSSASTSSAMRRSPSRGRCSRSGTNWTFRRTRPSPSRASTSSAMRRSPSRGRCSRSGTNSPQQSWRRPSRSSARKLRSQHSRCSSSAIACTPSSSTAPSEPPAAAQPPRRLRRRSSRATRR
jgi:AAA ATPase domain